jgi:dTDP-4-amino-4,6-dideoxygalactose transaminase
MPQKSLASAAFARRCAVAIGDTARSPLQDLREAMQYFPGSRRRRRLRPLPRDIRTRHVPCSEGSHAGISAGRCPWPVAASRAARANGTVRHPVMLTLDRYVSHFPGAVHFYGNASHGFKDVLTWLRGPDRRRTPNVLMPGYIPAKLYRTLLAAGYTVRFYDIGPACEFDPAEVADLADEDTLAIVVVHYFGLPSDLEAIRKFASQRGIFLIEDCALTLAARSEGRLLGTVGDCALFSVRKMLLLPEGGFLALNTNGRPFAPSYARRVSSLYSAYRLLGTRAKRLYFWLARGRDPLRAARCPATGYINLSERHHITVRTISWLSAVIARTVDLEKMAARRRTNYLRLLEALRALPYLQPLRPDLPAGTVPYSLPVRVADGRRDALREDLRRIGVACGAGWPESPFESHLTKTRDLAQSVLELPVHHLLSTRQVTRLVEHLRDPAALARWA